ncbi:MAG: PD-(D/E)XK nuclease family protein [Spongiibacteraceae bacterium]
MTPTATTLFDVEPLRAAVASGHLLLTPNRRLASRIRAALVADARTGAVEGRATVVQTPSVLALTDWLDKLWQQLAFRGDTERGDRERGADTAAAGRWILNADQERVLWERVIRASPIGAALLRPAQAAELAASALRSIVLWRQWPLSSVQRGYFSDADNQCFLDWLAQFEVLCREQGCITQSERDHRVAVALRAKDIQPSQPITLVCFDELAPLYAELFAALDAETALIPARNHSAQVVACDGFEQQIRAGARWIQRQLTTNNTGPFALVVPDLNSQRQRVERILLDELMANHILPALPRQLPPVNFSAGEPLADTPVIQSALRLLSLLLPDISRADVLAVLHSPFIDGGTGDNAVNATAMAITRICDLLTDSVSGGQLRGVSAAIAERFEGWSFDRALQQLADYSRRAHLAHLRAPLSAWAEHFQQALMLLGWPGARTLDSLEYQQVSQWQELLAKLSAFDDVSGHLTLAGALTALRQLATARVFQPKTPDAPIQVLGLLEAAGLQFEGLWLCDMADDQWPPPASPHPLLPRDWQRRLRMPHCDAEREFSVAQQLSISLRANARSFVVSYQRERDDVERHVSPLFQDLPTVDLPVLKIILAEPFKPAIPVSTAGLQNFDPGAAPRLDLNVRARGGSAVLADQAACPFRAFARHRLRAEPLGEPQTGLSASERGVLLHAALQALWQPLQNSSALRACDEAELFRRADAAAVFALQQLPGVEHFGPRFIALETQRLSRVLLRWIELELERAEFEIAALEEERRFNFAGLDLRLRVDRIDRLPDGRVTIVDYKSGQSNSINAWLGERPEQPQLPLYALALEHEQQGSVAGVTFAQVRLDTPRWIGLGDEQLEMYGLKPVSDPFNEGTADWPERLQAWLSSLQALANEFIQGRADVEPMSPKSCQYCALPSVCRIDHEQLEAAAEQPGEGEL